MGISEGPAGLVGMRVRAVLETSGKKAYWVGHGILGGSCVSDSGGLGGRLSTLDARIESRAPCYHSRCMRLPHCVRVCVQVHTCALAHACMRA